MTDLPLRPKDGGIDWERYSLDPKIRDHYRQFVTATLERVAKWHDKQAARQVVTDTLIHGSQREETYNSHKQSSAAIRAMKP